MDDSFNIQHFSMQRPKKQLRVAQRPNELEIEQWIMSTNAPISARANCRREPLPNIARPAAVSNTHIFGFAAQESCTAGSKRAMAAASASAGAVVAGTRDIFVSYGHGGFAHIARMVAHALLKRGKSRPVAMQKRF